MTSTENLKETVSIKSRYRWVTLIAVSLVMFASYYFYDVFSGIKSTMMAELNFTNTEYGLFYGIYSFSNFFLLMAVLGGVILDKWGIRKTGLLFFGFMASGVFLTAYGASDMFNNGGLGYAFFNSFLTKFSPQLKMMIFGRFLFGLGAETLYVAINKVLVKWFKGKELALSMGLSLSVARFGTAAGILFSPVLIEAKTGWTTAPWFGTMLVMVSLLSFLSYLFLDVKYDKDPKSREGETTEEQKEDTTQKTEKAGDIFTLLRNPSLWFITLLCMTFYSAVFPFMGFATDFIQNKFGYSNQLSSLIVTILPFGTILFTPLFGWYCDKKGKSASVMVLGSFMLVLVHITLSLTTITPLIPMFVLGIAFSLIPAAMWPSVAKIVPNDSLGTAYGFMFFIQNLGLWGIPALMGMVLDMTNKGVTAEMVEAGEATLNYTPTVLMLSLLGIMGLFFAFMLKRADKKAGYGLELPNKEA